MSSEMTLTSSLLQPPRLWAKGTRLEESKEEDSGKSQDEGGLGARNNPIRRGQPTSIPPAAALLPVAPGTRSLISHLQHGVMVSALEELRASTKRKKGVGAV